MSRQNKYEYIISFDCIECTGSVNVVLDKPLNSTKTKRDVEKLIERKLKFTNVGIANIYLARKIIKKRKFIK